MKASPLLTVLAILNWSATAVSPAAEPPSEATCVIARHLEAIGGRAAAEAATSVTVSGTLGDAHQSSEFTLQIKAPGRILLTIRDATGQPVRQARDAHARFWQQDSQGIRELEAQQASELVELVLALFPAGQAALVERLADALCERTNETDRPVVILGRRSVRGSFPTLIFDEASGLLIQIGQSTLSDYRPAGPLRSPHRVRWASRTEVRLNQISFNETIADVAFERRGVSGGWLSQLGPGLVMSPQKCHTKLSTPGTLDIVRQPPPARLSRGRLRELPKYDPTSGANWQVDLRGTDLTRLDVSSRTNDLMHADFDSNTRWPASLPSGFDPGRILQLGQDPGLGIRRLHGRGITGKGIGIGIIDQSLLVDHEEYAGQLRLYEEIHNPANSLAQMHGPAVASIAVGKTCGVAPDADLYYIAEQHGVVVPGKEFELDFTPLAQSIHRLLDVNQTLPPDRKLRVISISVGWTPDQKGYAETMAAVQRASAAGVFVISTSLRHTHNLLFDGLGRVAHADPNLASSYQPGSWWAAQFWGGQMRFKPGRRLCVPMDSRSTASPTGPHDYVHYAVGGWSWCVPWIAGLYALACQAEPSITPERFWSEALRTGTTIAVYQDTDQADLGTLANPMALLEQLYPLNPQTTPSP